jgi:RND superfamily putative drug exporter
MLRSACLCREEDASLGGGASVVSGANRRVGLLHAWGHAVSRWPWWVLVLSLAPLGPAAAVLITQGAHFDNSLNAIGTESERAAELIDRQLPAGPPSFGLIFGSPDLSATDPVFRDEMERALAPLRGDPRVARVTTAWDAPSARPLLSRDERLTYALVELPGRVSPFESMHFSRLEPGLYPALRGQVRSDTLEVTAFGSPALHADFVEMIRRDLVRCEMLALPVVLVLLLLVFRSAVAASLPLVVGILAVVASLGGTLLLARLTTVSVYAASLVTMIGLGVAIDYSLFIVSRFREERARRAPPDALARVLETTGRAVIFSGLTVAIGFFGLILVPIGSVASLSMAGALVVVFSVFYSVTLLPAALAILGPRVEALRVPFLWAGENDMRQGMWSRLTTAVTARPWSVLLPVLALLLVLGSPFRRLELATGDARVLPISAESRQGDALLATEFPGRDEDPLVIVLRYADGAPTTEPRIGRMYDFSRAVGRLRDVVHVDSIVDLDASVSRDQYQQLASLPPALRPPEVRPLFDQTVGPHIATLLVHTAASPATEATRALVRSIRAMTPPADAELLVTGRAAFDLDFAGVVAQAAPLAVSFVVLATYVVLFFLLRSVLLPLKAIVINTLSITVSYGALVWIFQDGHLAGWLGFQPGPIEPPIPLIMFCVLFGLSMDYEVLLLSRTREEYERTGNTTRAVIASLERTGRLITGAAAIMATVFFSFGFAGAVAVKAVGIGMGLAVVVDATIVRALLVPATMRLMGRWNWWVPAPLARLLHPSLSFGRAVGATGRKKAVA